MRRHPAGRDSGNSGAEVRWSVTNSDGPCDADARRSRPADAGLHQHMALPWNSAPGGAHAGGNAGQRARQGQQHEVRHCPTRLGRCCRYQAKMRGMRRFVRQRFAAAGSSDDGDVHRRLRDSGDQARRRRRVGMLCPRTRRVMIDCGCAEQHQGCCDDTHDQAEHEDSRAGAAGHCAGIVPTVGDLLDPSKQRPPPSRGEVDPTSVTLGTGAPPGGPPAGDVSG